MAKKPTFFEVRFPTPENSTVLVVESTATVKVAKPDSLGRPTADEPKRPREGVKKDR